MSAVDRDSVPFWWIVLFLLLAFGGGAVAILTIGGTLVAGVALPLF